MILRNKRFKPSFPVREEDNDEPVKQFEEEVA